MDRPKRCAVCDVVLELPAWWKPCGQGKVKSVFPVCNECLKLLLGRWKSVNVPFTPELGD